MVGDFTKKLVTRMSGASEEAQHKVRQLHGRATEKKNCVFDLTREN